MKILVIAAMLLAAGEAVYGQTPAFAPGGAAARTADSIDAARELYASARYDEALAVLNGLGGSNSSGPAEKKLIEQYRSLCLLALGRADEAEAAIAAVVRVDPFYKPSEAEASPRVRATFADVRERLLPDLATARYAEAKQAYDRKSFAEASARFRELVVLLDDPQMAGRLSDLRTLAAGFVELATTAAAPPPPPKEKEIEAAEPSAPVEPKKSAAPRIYTAEDDGVVPPVIIHQDLPSVPASIVGMTRDKGVLDVVIDEQGRVVSIALRARVHPLYDTALMTAARDWKYKPAQLNGTPVKYRKLLQISVKR
jgi:tetratricopeptide (TPR) repeat protein